MGTREQVLGFVRELLRRKGDVDPVADDDSLVLSGRLDSVEVIEIVDHFEAAFGVDFASLGFDRDDFETITTMLALLARSRQAA